MARLISSIIFMFIFFQNANAQFIDYALKVVDREYLKNNYFLANNYIEFRNYEAALAIFLELDSLFPNNANIKFNVGRCIIESNEQKSKAVPYLERAIKSVSPYYTGEWDDTTAAIHAFYYLGRAYHLTNKPVTAIDYFRKYNYYVSKFYEPAYYSDTQKETILKDIDRQIEMCYNAKKLMTNPVNIQIENLGANVNTKYDEYSAVISSDGKTLIFTSRREGSTGGLVGENGQYYEDIYITSFNEVKQQWDPVRNMGPSINTDGHEASNSLSNDGKQLLIYHEQGGNGNLFVSTLVDNEWSFPVTLGPEINSRAWETHGCLSPDNNTLYFTSDRRGGFGGRDIWVSERLASGGWSKPRNAGERINTEYDEDFPFIMQDGVTLYFSSRGHESMGGFDNFTSTLSEFGTWSEPENIGYPLNTTDEDVFFMPCPDGEHAYYSSEIDGGFGGQDIYKITILEKKRKSAVLRGIIFDSETYKPIVAKVIVKDVQSGEIIASLNNNANSGAYYVSIPLNKAYELTFTADHYQPYSERLEALKDVEINKAIMMIKSMEVQQEDVLPEVKIDEPDFVLYSGRVVDEDINTPVWATITITNKSSETDPPIIITVDKETGSYKTMLVPETTYEIITEATGYFFDTEVFTPKKDAAVSEMKREVKLKKMSVGKKVVLKNIFFDSGKAILREASVAELVRMKELMENNPTLRIEIAGYTDNLGDDGANQILSEKRARAVVDYLLNLKINPDRLTYKGYGRQNPVASNETEAGRQQNRRTEFKIIGQ